jgi:LysM repeat protein
VRVWADENFQAATSAASVGVVHPALPNDAVFGFPLAQPATAPAEPPMPLPSQYTVQAGDNIFTISRRMNVSFTELAEANNLSSPRDVRVGQVLVSPSAQRDAM